VKNKYEKGIFDHFFFLGGGEKKVIRFAKKIENHFGTFPY
jgi:hypothetical protein